MNLDVFKKQWDRVAAVVLTVLGVVALVNGWLGVSDTALQYEQASYMISGGIGGLFLLVLGAALWISADLRDEWNKLDRIEDRLDGIEQALVNGAGSPAVGSEAAAHSETATHDAGNHARPASGPALSVAGRKHA